MTTAKKLKVTDDDIYKIISMRDMKKALAKKLEKLDVDLRKNEKEVIELLECGAEIDSSFNVSVNELYKTYPRYKEEIEKRLGEDVVKEIIDSTEPTKFVKLVIS
ncbi:MAG: hypothetical protein H6621_06515 [Halobacteriovoraceae bacterium]|nr:hypothetical protein [Halobacteriovoraceae bacterium]